MKTLQTIYNKNGLLWHVIARDPEKAPVLIDTNEYVIVSGNEAILLDPGGMEIFPVVFSALSAGMDPRKIKYIFSSHQDPDIISSLQLWLEIDRDIRCYTSWLWAGFIPHFGGHQDTFVKIPDEGMIIKVGGREFQAIAAHYLHSSGNFHFYDPEAEILFSGDVGAALLPPEMQGMFVEDFMAHIKHAELFHRRWMPSNRAKNDWIARMRQLKIRLMCPQHGAIYREDDVKRFLDWFEALEVGSAVR